MRALFLFLSLIGTQTHAVTETEGLIGEIPAIWKVDVFSELKNQFPTIESKKIILGWAVNNDSRWLRSQLCPQPKKADRCTNSKSFSKAVDVERGGRAVTVEAGGQKLQVSDRLVFNYNQKILIFIPDLQKAVWLTPVRGRISIEENPLSSAEMEKLKSWSESPADLPPPKTAQKNSPFLQKARDLLKSKTGSAQ